MKKVHFTDSYLINPQHPVTIHLIGAGGTGSQVLEALARMDAALIRLGHPGLYVTVFDADEVSESNIGRQLFSPADIGLNKAICLVTRTNQFFGLDWEAVPEMYSDDAPSANITISCVDNVKSRLVIYQHLKQVNHISDVYESPLYWLDFGNTQQTGQVILGTVKPVKQPKKAKYPTQATLPTLCDMFDLTQVDEQNSGPSCSVTEALRKQDLFINSTLAQTDAPYYGSCSEKLNLSTTVYSSIFRLLKPIPLLWGLKCPHSHHTKHHVLNFPSTYISIPFIFSYLLYLYHSTSLDTVPLYLYRTLISLHRTHFSWIVLICKVFLLNFSLCITAVLFT